VKWREIRQLAQPVDHVRVEYHRSAELHATVHDAVADGVGAAEPVDGRVELERVGPRRRRLQILGAEQLVVFPEQAELQAARAGVDD
jgi:hypothetical protein